MEIELYQIKNMMQQMAELGAANYAKMMSPGNDSLSQREAYRMYGEARVRRWVRNGNISTQRSGDTKQSKIIYSRAELMAQERAERFNGILSI